MLLVLLFLISPVLALQQTSGAINLSVEPGNSVVGKYGVRNDENVSVDINFNVTGDASKFITYEKVVTLNPNEFRYINITANVPKDYVGSKNLTGTIYALKEGKKGGQVQINIRLGKNINLNIVESPISTPKVSGFSSLMFIGMIFMVYVVIKIRKTNK